jgi:hypothetical protein
MLPHKKGLEIPFSEEGRELFWPGASAYKMRKPDTLRRKKRAPGIKAREEMERALLKEIDIDGASHPWQHRHGFQLLLPHSQNPFSFFNPPLGFKRSRAN